jgi:hypothetical protein
LIIIIWIFFLTSGDSEHYCFVWRYLLFCASYITVWHLCTLQLKISLIAETCNGVSCIFRCQCKEWMLYLGWKELWHWFMQVQLDSDFRNYIKVCHPRCVVIKHTVESRTVNKHNRYRVWYYKCIDQYIIIGLLRDVMYISFTIIA